MVVMVVTMMVWTIVAMTMIMMRGDGVGISDDGWWMAKMVVRLRGSRWGMHL